jgi:CRISPR-associated protein Cas1
MTTLYLTEPQSTLRKDGDTLVVRIPARKGDQPQPERKITLPLLKILHVVVYGDVTLTSPALHALLENQASITFLSHYGKFLGQLEPPMSKNSLVRRAQFAAQANYPQRMLLARQLVLGKLANQRTLLMRYNRKLQSENLSKAIQQITDCVGSVQGLDCQSAVPPDLHAHSQQNTIFGRLQGLEGQAASAYFSVFAELLRHEWDFPRRTRRPPADPANALLSYAYTLLMQQVLSAIQMVGLDPYIGYLHVERHGKPSLALDIMETFRPIIADSVVLTLLNNHIIRPTDFENELGIWRLSDNARKIFLLKFEERLNTEIQHPIFGYKASYRRCLELQVRLLARYLQNEIPEYPNLVVR